MAWQDLSPTEQAEVKEFLREFRASTADVVRGLRKQQLLTMAYVTSIGSLWARIGNDEIIPDESGLAGADTSMTKADFTPKLTWASNVITAIYSDNGGASATVWPDRETVDSYGVQLAGPNNI